MVHTGPRVQRPAGGTLCRQLAEPGRSDYESVLDTLRLESGLLWPVPVALYIPDATAGCLTASDRLALQDPEGFPHALLTVGDMWRPDKRREAETVTARPPGVRHLYEQVHDT